MVLSKSCKSSFLSLDKGAIASSISTTCQVHHSWWVSFAESNANTKRGPGGKDLEEIELNHLDGHKGSKPVRQANSGIDQNDTYPLYDRIGNGAADHIQLVSPRPLVYLSV